MDSRRDQRDASHFVSAVNAIGIAFITNVNWTPRRRGAAARLTQRFDTASDSTFETHSSSVFSTSVVWRQKER